MAVPERHRWMIVLEYRGTDYVGWQRQANGRSIQGVVEEALEKFLGHKATVSGSGRTDAGVHAAMQIGAFTTTVVRNERTVVDGLNHFLPDDVAVVEARIMPPKFEPRQWVLVKEYRYVWLDRQSRSPLRGGTVWHTRRSLDAEKMNEAAQCIVGRHDFSSFRAVSCQAAHAVRTIYGAKVVRDGPTVTFSVEGNGFLQHMVRILAGSLERVGTSHHPPEWLAGVLAARDRRQASPTAPAKGLTLWRVDLGDRPYPWGPPGGPAQQADNDE